MLEQDIRFLAEELEKEKLIVFVGAGVSKNSGLPDWNELIKDYADYRGIDKFTSKQFLTIPEEVFERYGSLKYYEIIEKRFSGKYFPNSIHRILKKMNLTYIVTTNYDTLIEDEINNLQVVSKDEDLPYTNSNKMLIKMHGDFKNKNIVLKKSDYDNYEKNFPLISTLIKGLFTTNTILFIGYSYNDVNVQQIMNWIKEILKEETRKAFLVEFTKENDKEEENNEHVNIISLKLLNNNNDEVLYEDKKEKFKNNYEKTLTKFLSDIYNEKENVKREKNFEIYKNLNYLMGIHLEKILKNSQLIYGYLTKEKIICIENNEIKNIKRYEVIFFQSKVNKIILNFDTSKEEEFVPYSRENLDKEALKIKEKLEKNKIIEEEFLETIYNYDYKNFKNLTDKYIEKKDVNKYVIIYGYLFFKEIDKAKKIIENMIEEKENSNNKNEKIMWDNFILGIIEALEIIYTEDNLNENKSFENIENLENKYFEYFKEKTQLYEEIINGFTFEESCNEINQFFDKIRKNEISPMLDTSYLDKVKYLEKDLFHFCFFNGLFMLNIEFMEKYIEILLMTYTNKNINVESQMFKNRNFLEEFEYNDFFKMLELSHGDLIKLFNEYTIKDLKCKEEISDKLIVLFKNILDWIEENNKEFMEKKDTLENIILIISKLDLTETQFEKLINLILNYKNSSIFFEDNSILGIVNNFRIMIYRNSENLNKEFFDKVLEKIFSIDRNRINENLLDYITYYFNKKEMPKISKNDKKLIKVIREYVFSKIKSDNNDSNNNIIEAYFEWESEKNEAAE